MIYREFNDLKLSGLGLGMMRLPLTDGKDSGIDEAVALELVDYAYKHGVNYYDTAWGYHGGHSELVTGKALCRYPRESFYLATKFPGFDKANMARVGEIFEKQLEKCRTPYFDFYLFHNVCEANIDDYLDPKFGVLDYLLKQKEAGRIRHLGFSAHGSMQVIKRFLDAYGKHIEFCQIQLNYMDWHFQNAEKQAALLRERGIPVWVMEPLRGGRLAVASEKKQQALQAICPGESVTGIAFRFLQSIPEIGMVLSGMSNMEQLKANIETWNTDAPLTKEQFSTLVAFADEEAKSVGLPCTSCRYCTSHCPQELPIPELIARYNERTVGNASAAPATELAAEKSAVSCIGCRSCEQVCPQKIRIADAMKALSSVTEK